MKTVAVFFGGMSVEHDVSVITGVLTLNSVNRLLFNPVPVYVDYDGAWYTGDILFDIDFYRNPDMKKLKKVTLVSGLPKLFIIKGKRLKETAVISVAVNCLHGERGEDGSLSGTLKMCGVPLASPGLLPSSVSMDKYITKTVLKGLGIKTLPCVLVKSDNISAIEDKIGYPVIIKPACLGSSIGVKKAENRRELEEAVAYAKRFGEKIIAEKCLQEFTEINCAALRCSNGKIKVSECERPIGKESILSFEDKYSGGKREFPAQIPGDTAEKIKKISEKVYAELDFTGAIRIDYFISGKNVFLNEINSVPGSLAYYLFCDTLKEFGKMITDMIRLAEKNFAIESSLVKKYSSSVLNISGGKGAKRL